MFSSDFTKELDEEVAGIGDDAEKDSISKEMEKKVAHLANNPPEELTKDQKQTWRRLLEVLYRDEEPMASLIGSAGTGKTFLTTRLIQKLTGIGLKILCTAPTHQATQVLSDTYDGDGLTVNTIHSALGLRVTRDGQGDYTLVQDGEPDVQEFDLVIVDESSMLGQREWNHLEPHTHGGGPKFLFTGDAEQLPPPEDSPSPALDQPGARLETIVRQASGNPIISLSKQIRQGGDLNPLPKPQTNGEKGIYMVRRYKAAEKAARAMEKNQTGTRFLAWRNKSVDKWADRIRSIRYPEAKRFAPGMTVLAREPYMPGEQEILFHTSALLKVLDVEKTNKKLGSIGPSAPAWKLDLYHESENRTIRDVYVTRGHGQQMLDEYTDKMAEAQNWNELYDAKESFAQLRYSAAATVHTSQGDSIKNVFLDVNDLKANYDHDERRALAYVGVTRAESTLVLVH